MNTIRNKLIYIRRRALQKGLLSSIMSASNTINKSTRSGRGNYMIASKDSTNSLEAIGITPIGSTQSENL